MIITIGLSLALAVIVLMLVYFASELREQRKSNKRLHEMLNETDKEHNEHLGKLIKQLRDIKSEKASLLNELVASDQKRKDAENELEALKSMGYGAQPKPRARRSKISSPSKGEGNNKG